MPDEGCINHGGGLYECVNHCEEFTNCKHFSQDDNYDICKYSVKYKDMFRCTNNLAQLTSRRAI